MGFDNTSEKKNMFFLRFKFLRPFVGFCIFSGTLITFNNIGRFEKKYYDV